MRKYPDMTELFARKEARRKVLATLPIEEKMEIAQRLQEVAKKASVPNTQERLRRYKQAHADDRCGKCALILRQHSLKEWQYCEYVLSGGELKST